MKVFQFKTLLFVCAGVLLGASPAWACPVCGLSSERGGGTYIFMTGIMSVLPLLLGGLIVGVLVHLRRAAKADGMDELPPAMDGAQSKETMAFPAAPKGL